MVGRTLFMCVGGCALLASGVAAKTTGSLRDGNWSDPAAVNPVWNNGIPVAGDITNISHLITLDTQFSTPPIVSVDQLNLSTIGRLSIIQGRSITVTTVQNDGTIAHGGLLMRADNVDGAGTLNMSAATVLSAAHIRQKFASVGAGASATIRPNATDSATSRLETLSIAGASGAWTGLCDLSDNALVVEYGVTSPLATIANQITHAWHGGDWSGKGIGSTIAANVFVDPSKPHKTGVGFGEASDLFTAFPNTFAGQSVDSTSIVVRYTLYGDASMDKLVDTVDFNLLASNFSATGARWTKGDFNYDSVVDTTDFNLLASSFGELLTGDLASTVVPEPSVTFAAILVVRLACRRTRPRAARAP